MQINIMENVEKNTEKYKVNNAIIMAAGMSSRFAPISYEYPKALLRVKGEVLIERQICQLKESGIHDITVVVGYKKELFYYLKDKFNVDIVENPEYKSRNNHSSLYYVKDKLSNTYICSADNYFTKNVFEAYVKKPYYSAVFKEGITDEWCIETDDSGLITNVVIGGQDSWIMLGHVFFNKTFSEKFVDILEKIYDYPETKNLLWEGIYIKYIKELPMYIRKYSKEIIFEFDTLDELRVFDETYLKDTRSNIIRRVCDELKCNEEDIVKAEPLNINGEIIGFKFIANGTKYEYLYREKIIRSKCKYDTGR